MRTTVTLDSDVDLLIKRTMKERGVSFKQALNDAVRAGTSSSAGRGRRVTWPTKRMGVPNVDVTKANHLAAELENQEIIRQMQRGV
jgi:hypothetical protein